MSVSGLPAFPMGESKGLILVEAARENRQTPLSCIRHHFPIAIGWALAGFSAFNLIGNWVEPGFDANVLWVPLAPYDGWLTQAVVWLTTVFLIWNLLRPRCGAWRYVVTQALLIFLALNAAVAGVKFYLRDEIGWTLPLPFAWLVAAVLMSQIWRVRRAASGTSPAARCDPEVRVLATAAGVIIVAVFFLLSQFFIWGTVSHLRRADCIIVMGAGVMPGGGPSTALYERTRTGCQLYLAGYAPHLVFTGGPGVPRASEPAAMASVARAMGIAPANCVLDELGRSTFDAAISARRIMRERGWRTALVVSHEYHLSRTWLTFRRAGVSVHTVPADRTRIIVKDVYHVPREMAAWIYYYFRSLWEPLR